MNLPCDALLRLQDDDESDEDWEDDDEDRDEDDEEEDDEEEEEDEETWQVGCPAQPCASGASEDISG